MKTAPDDAEGKSLACRLRRVFRRQAAEQRPEVDRLHAGFDGARIEAGEVENAREQAVQLPERLLHLADGFDGGRIAGDLPLDHGQQQHQRLHRLAQVVAGGGQEIRFGAVGALGLGLGGHEFRFGLLLRADVAEEDRQAPFAGRVHG